MDAHRAGDGRGAQPILRLLLHLDQQPELAHDHGKEVKTVRSLGQFLMQQGGRLLAIAAAQSIYQIENTGFRYVGAKAGDVVRLDRAGPLLEQHQLFDLAGQQRQLVADVSSQHMHRLRGDFTAGSGDALPDPLLEPAALRPVELPDVAVVGLLGQLQQTMVAAQRRRFEKKKTGALRHPREVFDEAVEKGLSRFA